ncbi:hypothetical protein M9H77_12849 [Catharanthus roseus]|uniref:Uncharacterized protein n=1 Tax=Catharanthus roseus TaxID=4058 RepID=A0ACC0BIH3_CATRO|nr:hypothetical protein M9H77_12849 [Catharanthus roseus]
MYLWKYNYIPIGMIGDAQETVDLFQGLVTRAKAKRKEEEHKGMVAIFTKMIQNFTWHVVEEQGEDSRGQKPSCYLRYKRKYPKKQALESTVGFWPRRSKVHWPTVNGRTFKAVHGNAMGGEDVDRNGTKILLKVMLHKREPKEASVKDKKKRLKLQLDLRSHPTVDDRIGATIIGRSLCSRGQAYNTYHQRILVYTFLVHCFGELEDLETPQEILRRIEIENGKSNYQRECEKYHEGSNHSDDTHEGYNFGAYSRNDCDEKWRYLRSMITFYGNRSYGNKSMVDKGSMYRGDIVDRDMDRRNGIEDQGKSSEKELRIIHEHITISFSLNPLSLCHEVSLRELEMLLVAYTSHVCMFEELCAISLDRNIFLLVPCMLKCLTPYDSLANQLMPNVFKYLSSHASFVNHLIPSEAKLDLIFFELENLHDDSFIEPKVVENGVACAVLMFFMLGLRESHLIIIASFNASASNVACLLWLFEGLDPMKNPFKERGYGMTQDEHENMEIFQGPAKRSMARKIEEERTMKW